MPEFKTFESHFGHDDQTLVALKSPGSDGDKALPTGASLVGKAPLVARCYRSMWIVDCPDCGGAELAAANGQFFCCGCRNASVGGAYRLTVFPDERVEIESILAVRPTENRNWFVDEPLDGLVAENVAKGVAE